MHVFSTYRYEIREDRRREILRAENHLETLRKDIIHAIRGSFVDHPNQNYSYPNHQTNFSGDYSQPAHAGYNPTDHISHASRSQVDEHRNTQRKFKDTLIRNLENISYGNTPENFTSAKVESYLSHLEHSTSSQTTDTYPLPNLTSDPFKSHSGEVYAPRPTNYGQRYHSDATEHAQNHTETSFNQPRSRILSNEDIESIKLEVLTSLKSELRESARDVAKEILSPSPATNIVPDLYSDLYQTHLYTQL
jgi:hypothetical protein